jgi:predicted DNA-binding transcriptional regulator AlpA
MTWARPCEIQCSSNALNDGASKMEKDNKRLLSRIEVEKVYGIGRRFLELAVARGDGPRFVRVGRLVRYRISDLDTWIETNAIDGGKS